MKTRLLCFLMVLALLPCLALAEDAPQKLVVAEPVHLIGYLPLYVAIHEGYFADEGLDVTVVQATGGKLRWSVHTLTTFGARTASFRVKRWIR